MIWKIYAALSTGLNIWLFLAFLHTRKELVKCQQTLGVLWKNAVERRREKLQNPKKSLTGKQP